MIRKLLHGAFSRGLARVLELAHERLPAQPSGHGDRVYLFGFRDEGFPGRTLIGRLPWAVYLDRVDCTDPHPELYSQPWGRAWSIGLLGSYVEEMLHGSAIVLCERMPWSLRRLTDETFHRVAQLSNGSCWRLLAVTKRSGDWYFRLADGYLVEGLEFLARHATELAAAQRTAQPCGTCFRLRADAAAWQHVIECEYEYCTFGRDLCWGEDGCDNARRELERALLEQHKASTRTP